MNTKYMQKLSSYSLLFVENEEGIRNNLNEILSLYFKKVYIAVDGEDGYEQYQQHKPDLIITDIKMPQLSGIEMIQRIRQDDSQTDIVIVSAYTELDDILTSVELNLLKYIVKPITQTKLEDVFTQFLKKRDKQKTINLIKDCIYYPAKNSISCKGKEYLLTNKENNFIQLLLEKDSIVTYNEIEEKLWDGKHMSLNALRLFIKNFRKKIPVELIQNIQNEGYLLKS